MIQLDPVAYFYTEEKKKADLPRQSALGGSNRGEIHFLPGKNFEQALHDLQGMERIWVLFWMHQVAKTCIKVQPPRSVQKKGVFATRSPHRPNPIGMSCVRLKSVEGRVLIVEEHDILNGSPILDVKPYLPYADSFANVKMGWIERERDLIPNEILFTEEVKEQLHYLAEEEGLQLQDKLVQRLQFFIEPTSSNRIKEIEKGLYEQAYTSWRILFRKKEEKTLEILSVRSGYSSLVLQQGEGDDVKRHRRFTNQCMEGIHG
ncbi:MAG: tRNA (N6-threonylcarbamoyladenosine(37)-N6)-methyltransferase TrmO [Chlamydiae bacterium]|nr:tRNA (N6-threonylcarbamoyladenosine(37)-N6)-methyltransferase TrmO [Chlamydiota bacterium]